MTCLRSFLYCNDRSCLQGENVGGLRVSVFVISWRGCSDCVLASTLKVLAQLVQPNRARDSFNLGLRCPKFSMYTSLEWIDVYFSNICSSGRGIADCAADSS
jgi:hypothetical protein